MDTIWYFYKKRGLKEPEPEPVGLKSYMLVRVALDVGEDTWFGDKLGLPEKEAFSARAEMSAETIKWQAKRRKKCGSRLWGLLRKLRPGQAGTNPRDPGLDPLRSLGRCPEEAQGNPRDPGLDPLRPWGRCQEEAQGKLWGPGYGVPGACGAKEKPWNLDVASLRPAGGQAKPGKSRRPGRFRDGHAEQAGREKNWKPEALLEEWQERVCRAEASIRKLAGQMAEWSGEGNPCYCVYEDSVRKALMGSGSCAIEAAAGIASGRTFKGEPELGRDIGGIPGTGPGRAFKGEPGPEPGRDIGGIPGTEAGRCYGSALGPEPGRDIGGIPGTGSGRAFGSAPGPEPGRGIGGIPGTGLGRTFKGEPEPEPGRDIGGTPGTGPGRVYGGEPGMATGSGPGEAAGTAGTERGRRILPALWGRYFDRAEFTDYCGRFWVELLMPEAILPYFVILGNAACIPELIGKYASRIKSLKWILPQSGCTEELQGFVEDFYIESGLAISLQAIPEAGEFRKLKQICALPSNILDFTGEAQVGTSGAADGSIWLDMCSVEEKRRRIAGRRPEISYFSLKEKWKCVQRRCKSPV